MKYFASLCVVLAGMTFTHIAVAQDETASAPAPNSVMAAVRAARGGTAKVEIPGQVFFRNNFAFKGGRKAEGGSASLIAKNGNVYVLTAKHLLGEAMGIDPEVLPSEFNANFRKWKVVQNDGGKSVAKVTGIYKPNDDVDEDIILLKTNADARKVYGNSIDIAKVTPKVDDKLYMIGCPYALDSCVQRAYAGTVVGFTNFEQDPEKPENLILLDMIHSPDQLAGFSGAPILNQDMKVVAVVAGGGRSLVAATLLPDWVKD